MAAISSDYQFSAEPQPVRAGKAKYREQSQEEAKSGTNIMFDKRVVRGNTFATMVVPASNQQEMERQQELERKRKKREQELAKKQAQVVQREVSTPKAVDGRKHEEAQTDNVVEELTDKPQEFEIETQTEFVIDRPPTPLFMPEKTGLDRDTQVEDGELFDFNEEVEPILQVLVGKTMEQSRMEVLEEEEVEAMKRHQREFKQKRNAEMAEVQRLEDEERRKKEESDRRVLQQRARKQELVFAHQKFCSRIFSKRYMRNVKHDTLRFLQDTGAFRDPREVQFNVELLPWLLHTVVGAQMTQTQALALAQEIATQAFTRLSDAHKNSIAGEYQRREDVEERKREDQRATELRKQQRQEKRIERKRRQELEALKNRIEEMLIKTAETKEGMTSQVYSDFDGRQTGPIVGTPGGNFGEFLLAIAALEEVLEFTLAPDQIQTIFHAYLVNEFKGPLFAYPNVTTAAMEEFLRVLNNPEITPDTLHTLKDEAAVQLLHFLTDPSHIVPRTTLALLVTDPQRMGIRVGLYEAVVQAFHKEMFVKIADESLSAEIRGKVKVRPTDPGIAYTDVEGTEIAIVRIRIPMKPADLTDAKGDETGEAEAPAAADGQPQEIDVIEDRVKLVHSRRDDLAVFVLHQAAQRFLRRELAYFVKSIRGYEHVNPEKLMDAIVRKAETVERVVMREIGGDLPVFDFEIN
jgi:hypothetical protein